MSLAPGALISTDYAPEGHLDAPLILFEIFATWCTY